MHAAAGLSRGDLRCKGDRYAIFVGQRTQHPFGDQQLVGCILKPHRRKFDLVLLVRKSRFGEITHLRMSVLDVTPAFGDGLHGLRPQFLPLAEGRRFMVPALVHRLKQTVLLADDVIFKFAHHFERKPGLLLQHLM